MSNQSGYVYLLKNEAMPGIYKIGMTNRSVEERVKELSLSTSVPLPFEIVCSVAVDNAMETENELHEEYEDFRISSNREFFRFNDEEIKSVVTSFACFALSKMLESERNFHDIYNGDIERELLDIAINSLNVEPIFLEEYQMDRGDTIIRGGYVPGSELLSLLRGCLKQGENILVPMSLYKVCSISEYKKILKANVEPQYLKQCIEELGFKTDLFGLKDLLED